MKKTAIRWSASFERSKLPATLEERDAEIVRSFRREPSPEAIRANRAAAIEQENYDEGRVSRRRARVNPHGD